MRKPLSLRGLRVRDFRPFSAETKLTPIRHDTVASLVNHCNRKTVKTLQLIRVVLVAVMDLAKEIINLFSLL